jgi:uncharacterized protein (TIGR03067 family)
MKRRSMSALAFVLAISAGGRALAADAGDDQEKLQGKWKSYSFEATGRPKNSKLITLEFKDDLVIATIGEEYTKYQLELNADEHPKQIDLIPLSGKVPSPEMVDRGLYSLDGDELTIALGGQQRPDKLQLRDRPGDSLIKLKRISRKPR